MSLLGDVGAYLIASTSLGLSYGSTGSLWLGGFAEQSPDVAVALIEYPGREPLRAMNAAAKGAPVAERPRIQVLVRESATNSYSTGRDRAEAIYQYLDMTGEFNSTSGVRFLNIVALQPPFKLEQDDSTRTVWAFNVEAWKERA